MGVDGWKVKDEGHGRKQSLWVCTLHYEYIGFHLMSTADKARLARV